MPKKGGFYSTTIPVGGKKGPGANPFGTVGLGSATLPIVPVPTGQAHGIGPHEKPFRKTYVKGAHGYGHPAKHRQGSLRNSGDTSAHRLGAPKVKGAVKAPKVGD